MAKRQAKLVNDSSSLSEIINYLTKVIVLMGKIILASSVLIFRNDRVLLSERFSKNYNGFYSAPGGKLEFGEHPTDCVKRETIEEAGITLGEVRPLGYIASHFKNDNHYICFWHVAYMNNKAWDGKVDFVELNRSGKPKTGPWKWFTRKAVEKLQVMPALVDAWDYFESAIGNPFITIDHGNF